MVIFQSLANDCQYRCVLILPAPQQPSSFRVTIVNLELQQPNPNSSLRSNPSYNFGQPMALQEAEATYHKHFAQAQLDGYAVLRERTY